jgi:hypothetical protein
MKIIDTAELIPQIGQLEADGITGFALYARVDRTPLSEVQRMALLGAPIVWIWEEGEPTSADYFNADQGAIDARKALLYFQSFGTLIQGPYKIFPTVDYDASEDDLAVTPDGCVIAYLRAFHAVIMNNNADSRVGVYGSGLTCETAIAAGVAHWGWMDQSTGHAGHTEYLDRADIVQGPSTTIDGVNCDTDEVNNEDVLTYLKAS